MIKYFLFAGLLTSLAFPQQALASTDIVCENGEFSIEISVDSRETMPPQSSYKVYKNQELVKQGNFFKAYEGYEGSLLKAYVWEFADRNENSIGVATSDFQKPTAGSWVGMSDVSIDTSVGDFYDDTIDCEIKIVGSGN